MTAIDQPSDATHDDGPVWLSPGVKGTGGAGLLADIGHLWEQPDQTAALPETHRRAGELTRSCELRREVQLAPPPTAG